MRELWDGVLKYVRDKRSRYPVLLNKRLLKKDKLFMYLQSASGFKENKNV